MARAVTSHTTPPPPPAGSAVHQASTSITPFEMARYGGRCLLSFADMAEGKPGSSIPPECLDFVVACEASDKDTPHLCVSIDPKKIVVPFKG